MIQEELFDSGDPKAVKERRATAKQKEDLALEGLRVMLTSEPGRAWLYRALAWTRLGVNPYSQDPIQMAFNCGEANIGQQMMADMQAVSFELYLQMIKENQ